MHGNRRRKKRPSYGVRTIGLTKGQHGFGFTISGQEPCILSCIVPGSPADVAGLRPGDYLIAVNGENVSKYQHDDVVKLIGQSLFLQLQIAENYYSDSSDEDVASSRPKPKYPNRLRQKQQQSRVEKVVSELHSGVIFNDPSCSPDNTNVADPDWPESYPLADTTMDVMSVCANKITVTADSVSSTSPTRLRPDQIPMIMAEANKKVNQVCIGREIVPLCPSRLKAARYGTAIDSSSRKNVQCLMESSVDRKDCSRHVYGYSEAESKPSYSCQIASQKTYPPRSSQFQDLTNRHDWKKPKPLNGKVRPSREEPSSPFNCFPLDSRPKGLQCETFQSVDHRTKKPVSNQLISEQDINNIIYPTLAELKQNLHTPSFGESIYRAVVGYLGTIEMPKEPQGASRLTTIRNCIRRLKIEKKVHTLVLMSIYPELVALTNTHGMSLATYPAENITFCGIYADDKKFFGLVTINLPVNNEGVVVEAAHLTQAVSSSCHVFMVNSDATKHVDHQRQARNFHIDCTPAELGNGAPCAEFPNSADPILHSIMNLYRNRVGVHMYAKAPGFVDFESDASPRISNTSSNSSNSDSGIGYKDEGNVAAHGHLDRIYVVEFDDNQQSQLQNFQMVPRPLEVENPQQLSNIKRLNSNINSIRANFRGAYGGPKVEDYNTFKNSLSFHNCAADNRNTSSYNRTTGIDSLTAVGPSDANIRRNSNVTSTPNAPTGRKLTVQAMPDPLTLEYGSRRTPVIESPEHVDAMRHSMHRYLQNKKEHLTRISRKITNQDNALTKGASALSDSNCTTSNYLVNKLSPKVFDFPFPNSSPSECSYSRSLEDVREGRSDVDFYLPRVSSKSSMQTSDISSNLSLMHRSESNLSKCGVETPLTHHRYGCKGFDYKYLSQQANQLRIPCPVKVDFDREPSSDPDQTLQVHSILDDLTTENRQNIESADENTETTENTGDQGGSQVVHPPTQDEFSQDSDFDPQLSQRAFREECPETPIGDHVTRVASWATSFEKLLDDSAGLHTFTEFLKKEISHENIYFWTAVERYKKIDSPERRKQVAKEIFERHLAKGAPEPVNIDAQACQKTQEGLQNPDKNIFNDAQKHIFILMKFDSYSRFLKSELYTSCLNRELQGLPLIFIDEPLEFDLRSGYDTLSKLKKSKSDAEESRRKSLLPWNRKHRSKNKEKNSSIYPINKNNKSYCTASDTSSTRSDITSSRTSLNSSDISASKWVVNKENLSTSDLSLNNSTSSLNLCRLILPDKSNSVLALKPGVTVKELVSNLLERRKLNYSSFNVITVVGRKNVKLSDNCSVLLGQEATVEHMASFVLTFPNGKTISVRAKIHKPTSDVLKPILSKFGYKFDLVAICKFDDRSIVSTKGYISKFDEGKFEVVLKENFRNEKFDYDHTSINNNNLDEITNRVFEDLLNVKAQQEDNSDFEIQSKKTDTSSNCSSRLGTFTRRLSLPSSRKDVPGLPTNNFSKQNDSKSNPSSVAQDIELYEGLKRAQKSRLDDQRGTEINFELPEFLKSNNHQNRCTSNSFRKNQIKELQSQNYPEVWGNLMKRTQPTTEEDLDDTLTPQNDDDNSIPFMTPPPLPPKPRFGSLRGPPPKPPIKDYILTHMAAKKDEKSHNISFL